MKEKKDFIVDEFLGLNSEKEDENELVKEEDEIISPTQDSNNSEVVEVIDENEETTLEDMQKRIVDEYKKNNLINQNMDNSVLDPSSDAFVLLIKDNVSFCINELKDVDTTMKKINNQKSSEMFFRKSENIKLLSQYMSKMAQVNQKTLDLLILLLGANGKISDEYETILATIDELGELNHGEAEVLNYLLKVKKMVYEIRDNELTLKQVLEDNAITKEIVSRADEAFKKEIQESERARKIVDSKCNRLQKRITLNNIYIGICLLLIIALAIFIGVNYVL